MIQSFSQMAFSVFLLQRVGWVLISSISNPRVDRFSPGFLSPRSLSWVFLSADLRPLPLRGMSRETRWVPRGLGSQGEGPACLCCWRRWWLHLSPGDTRSLSQGGCGARPPDGGAARSTWPGLRYPHSSSRCPTCSWSARVQQGPSSCGGEGPSSRPPQCPDLKRPAQGLVGGRSLATSTGHVGAHPPLESRAGAEAWSGAGPGGGQSGVEAGRPVSCGVVSAGEAHSPPCIGQK